MNSLHLDINIDFQQLVAVVKQLSPSDKLKLNSAIWEDNIEIPIEHQKLVLGRMEKAKKDPTRMLDWEKASKTLKSK